MDDIIDDLSLHTLLTRIDERVKALVEQTEKTDERIEWLVNQHNALTQRVIVLESKDSAAITHQLELCDNRIRQNELSITEIGIVTKRLSCKWERWAECLLKLIMAVAAASIIYKLGFSPT
jgi:hypothetical protein